VDEYEALRDAGAPARRGVELLLGRMEREDLLREAGYSRSDFAGVEREVRRLRAQRVASARTSVAERVLARARRGLAARWDAAGGSLRPRRAPGGSGFD
jgi:hypothetical protein